MINNQELRIFSSPDGTSMSSNSFTGDDMYTVGWNTFLFSLHTSSGSDDRVYTHSHQRGWTSLLIPNLVDNLSLPHIVLGGRINIDRIVQAPFRGIINSLKIYISEGPDHPSTSQLESEMFPYGKPLTQCVTTSANTIQATSLT